MSTKTKKKEKIRILILIAQCAISILLYFIFFFGNPIIFLVLVVGSVALLSIGTLYTIINHNPIENKIDEKKPFLSKARALEKRRILMRERENPDLIWDYKYEMPSIQKYIESDKSYEEMPKLENFIFTELTLEDLAKINRLGLSERDKKQFIKELLYYTQQERMNLIDNMISNLNNTDEEIIHVPPLMKIEEPKTLRIYATSLIEPGEKKKILKIETTEFISSVKDQLANAFGYNSDDFLVSTGGIIMDENEQIRDYKMEDKDELVLIPSRIPKK